MIDASGWCVLVDYLCNASTLGSTEHLFAPERV